MIKTRNIISTLMLAVIMTTMPVACGSDGDDESGSTSSLTAANLTDDGYFDGLLYYQIASNTHLEVSIAKASKSATVVKIPSSVIIEGKTYKCTSIGDWAFYDCTGLASITIPNSVTSIGEGAFFRRTSLTNITIPNSVISIGEGAFRECTGLTNVTIGNSVTSIGVYAFRECTGLTSLTIGNSVASIGEGAFYECTALTSVTIPGAVKSIGEGAFYNCTGLTSVTIPGAVTSIESCAFGGCTALTDVYALRTKAEEYHCNISAFDNVPYSTATLHVPTGSEENYAALEPWCYFGNMPPLLQTRRSMVAPD